MKPKLRFKEFSGEWMEVRLKEIAVCEDNKRIPLNETERKQRKGIYPYWGSTKVMDYVNDYIFNGEYVLLSEDGGYFYDYKEKPIAFYVNGKFWANNHIHVLKINKRNSAKFIYYTLAHKNILAYIIGGTRTKLNQKDMLKIKIHLPPTLKEQQKIASFLSSIDEKIELTTKKIEKLKEYKKGLLQKLLNVKDGVPELRFPEFSGEWVEKKLGEIAVIKNGLSNVEDAKEDGKYLFFDRSEVVKKSNKFIFDTEAIIFAGEGSNFYPKYYKGKFDLHQRAYAIHKFDNINGKFLYYLLSLEKVNQYFKKIAVGTTVKSLRLPHFEKLKIHIPPTLEEQQKIAEFLSSIDDKIEINEQKLTKLKEYKKGLLQKMLI